MNLFSPEISNQMLMSFRLVKGGDRVISFISGVFIGCLVGQRNPFIWQARGWNGCAKATVKCIISNGRRVIGRWSIKHYVWEDWLKEALEPFPSGFHPPSPSNRWDLGTSTCLSLGLLQIGRLMDRKDSRFVRLAKRSIGQIKEHTIRCRWPPTINLLCPAATTLVDWDLEKGSPAFRPHWK